MSEHLEQVALFDLLRANESRHPELKWIFAVPNGGSRHPVVAGKLKAEGVKRGVSDICIPIARQGYHGAFIEMKFGKNKLTPEQKEFHEFLESSGYKPFVAYSSREAQSAIEGYLGIKLGR